MKELTNHSTLPSVDKQEIVENHEIKMLGKIRKRRGLKLFCYNNGAVTEAKFDSSDATIAVDGKVKKSSNITVQQGDFYLFALNMKNAKRRLKNLGKTVNE